MMLTLDWSDSAADDASTGARRRETPHSWLDSVRRLWCRHAETVLTPRVEGMPAHVVCTSCGWREPLLASRPMGTRTWDSSRDEARYLSLKKHREELEGRRQSLHAEVALSPRRAELPRRRLRASNVVELRRVGAN